MYGKTMVKISRMLPRKSSLSQILGTYLSENRELHLKRGKRPKRENRLPSSTRWKSRNVRTATTRRRK